VPRYLTKFMHTTHASALFGGLYPPSHARYCVLLGLLIAEILPEISRDICSGTTFIRAVFVPVLNGRAPIHHLSGRSQENLLGRAGDGCLCLTGVGGKCLVLRQNSFCRPLGPLLTFFAGKSPVPGLDPSRNFLSHRPAPYLMLTLSPFLNIPQRGTIALLTARELVDFPPLTGMACGNPRPSQDKTQGLSGFQTGSLLLSPLSRRTVRTMGQSGLPPVDAPCRPSRVLRFILHTRALLTPRGFPQRKPWRAFELNALACWTP